jgi:hypothetical protein
MWLLLSGGMMYFIVACTAIRMGHAENTISLLLLTGRCLVMVGCCDSTILALNEYATISSHHVSSWHNKHSGEFSRFLYGNTLSVIEDKELKIHTNILAILSCIWIGNCIYQTFETHKYITGCFLLSSPLGHLYRAAWVPVTLENGSESPFGRSIVFSGCPPQIGKISLFSEHFNLEKSKKSCKAKRSH